MRESPGRGKPMDRTTMGCKRQRRRNYYPICPSTTKSLFCINRKGIKNSCIKKAADLKLDDKVWVEIPGTGIFETKVDSLEKAGDVLKLYVGERKHVFYISKNDSIKKECSSTLYIDRSEILPKIISNQKKRVEKLEFELGQAKGYLSELKKEEQN